MNIWTARCAVSQKKGVFCKSCIKDEGRPFGIGLQWLVSNHTALLQSKVVVVSSSVKTDL